MSKLIPLQRDQHTIVDDEDYEWLMQWKWSTNVHGYVQARVNGKMTLMHRLLMSFPDKCIDHINLNKLDNQRNNLRLCTRAENNRNRGWRGGISEYKGVQRCKKTGKWVAQTKRIPALDWHA
jgi:hypothetical protein